MKKKIILSLIIMVVLLGGCSTNQGNNQEEVKQEVSIGIIMPTTGDLADLGQNAIQGAELFSQETDVNLIIGESKSDPKEALTEMYRLIDVYNVDAIFGPFGPTESEAVKTKVEENQKLTVAMSMCSDIFLNNTYFLCSYPSPQEQMTKTLSLLNSKSIAGIFGIGASSESLEETLKNSAKENKMIITNIEKINDLQSINIVVDKTIKNKPSTILVSAENMNMNMKIIESLKIKGYGGEIIYGTDISQEKIEEFKEVLEEVKIAGGAQINMDEEFIQKFKDRYNKEPNLYSAYGYFWTKALYKAYKKDIKDAESFREMINDYGRNFGITNMGYKGEFVTLPMNLYVVKQGNMELTVN